MFPLCLDLLFEVLLLLPATTLVQAKLVHREWHAVIASPLFVHHHHARIMSQHPGILLSWYSWFAGDDRTEYVEPADDANPSYIISILQPTPERLRNPSASCCGLISYYDKETRDIVVANPITWEYLRLPQLPHQSPPHDPERPSIGINRATGTYKVVVEKSDRSSLLVITLGDQDWRWVEIPPLQSRCYFKPPVPEFHQGRMVWLYGHKSFLLFDMVSESFRCWSEVDPREHWDATRHPALQAPQYVAVGEGHDVAWLKLHECKVCRQSGRKVFDDRWRFCYTEVELCWRPGWSAHRDWENGGLWDWQKKEMRYYSPHLIRNCERRILISPCLHYASLISPNEIARKKAQELGIDAH